MDGWMRRRREERRDKMVLVHTQILVGGTWHGKR
jgi:hypothetical protein